MILCAVTHSIRIASVAVLAGTLISCAIQPKRVSGLVIDADTGAPVADAYVYGTSGYHETCYFPHSRCKCKTLTAQLVRTDESGRYVFDRDFDFGSKISDQFGDVLIFAEGYINSPRMLSGIQLPEHFGTPESFVATGLHPQYFHGNGRYQEDFNETPLKKGYETFYLTKKPLYADPHVLKQWDGETPRVRYLNEIRRYFGTCEYQDGTRTGKLYAIKRAIYLEAVSLAVTKKDRKHVHQICLDAIGMHPILDEDKSCDIDSGPVR